MNPIKLSVNLEIPTPIFLTLFLLLSSVLGIHVSSLDGLSSFEFGSISDELKEFDLEN
jgi:hypothetical protein